MDEFQKNSVQRLNWLTEVAVLCKEKTKRFDANSYETQQGLALSYLQELNEVMQVLRKTIARAVPTNSFPQARVDVLLSHAQFLAEKAAHHAGATKPAISWT